MIQKILRKRTWFVALSCVTLLGGHAIAQNKAPPSTDPPAASAPVQFKSAFEAYRAYSDDQMTNWKAANDSVARIGGWREYAKQAQQPDDTPAAKAGDSKPTATP